MAIVYKHIRKDTNEVFYIGIGKSEKRAYDMKHARSEFHQNISKRGVKVEIVEEGLTWDAACNKERELIELYGRRDKGLGPLVNMTDGGDGGHGMIVSDETKEKIRQFQLSQDTPWKYRKRSDDEKERIRASLTGRKRPESVIAKLRKPKSNKENYSYPKEKIECPHCGKMAQPANAYRWHFDNCKTKTHIENPKGYADELYSEIKGKCK